VERIDSFLRGKDLGLVSINKFEQLRKYIANQYRNRKDRIRTKVSNPKGNLVRFGKLFRSKVDHTEINCSYNSFIDIERNHKTKGMLLPF
jgi:hypothetical protein